jgi:two-component system CheB/CheR fusion protein
MAFVVIQHLSPTHESALAEILARSTRLPVVEVRRTCALAPDRVYVIPPNRHLTVSRGVLRLHPRPRGPEEHRPIDAFFTSLAEDAGDRAIGILCSGSSTDGVEGLRRIKQLGGITLAQDEASAKYPEMPRSAVVAGAVDVVLSPDRMAIELARLRGHPFAGTVGAEPDEGARADEPEIRRVLEILRSGTGVDFALYKQSTVRRRILRRMALARLERLADYVALLSSHREEVEALYQDTLIKVTSFFRDPGAYALFSRRVLPALLKKRPADMPLRIWVPGCSTGEEVYSFAMCLLEHLGSRAKGVPIQIFGTDLSEVVLEKARTGRYPPSIANEVSAERLRRFFVRCDDGWQVSRLLRDVCVFARHNLTKDPPFSKIDFISCRNVLIYFGTMLQRRVLSLLHFALRPGGFLLLGGAEHVTGSGDGFVLADRRHKLYVKRAVPTRDLLVPAGEPFAMPPPHGPSLAQPGDVRPGDIQREADRAALSRYAPAGVVVDGTLQVLQVRGQVGPYLEARPGTASLNLLRMAREGLALDLRAAVARARRDGTVVRREKVRVRGEGGTLVDVALEVVPFQPSRGSERLFLVLFDPGPADRRPRRAAKPPAASAGGGRRARSARAVLEEELAAAKQYLQSIIEEQEATNQELISANEEIMSSNEELQSTNEELETAKEELQSSNEELSTVNDELQARNVELHDLNADLTHLLGLIHLPIVILDADMRIRRVTPPAQALLNVLPGDVGRRLTDLRHNLQEPGLEPFVRGVLGDGVAKEVEVRDVDGRAYAVSVRPYAVRGRPADGVLVTWHDNDAASQRARRAYWQAAEAVLVELDQPAALLRHDLSMERTNVRWRALFDGQERQGPQAWGHEDLLHGLQALAAGGPRLHGVPVRLAVGGVPRDLRVRANRIGEESGQPPILLLLIEQVSGAEPPARGA